jgi:hypothetical protein
MSKRVACEPEVAVSESPSLDWDESQPSKPRVTCSTHVGRAELESRFWSRVDKSPDGCWLWRGYLNAGGYGVFSAGARGCNALAHRFSYGLANGGVPPRKRVVRHLCHTTNCVRPDHLAIGTQKDNVGDSVRDGRHTFGVRNGNAKLTDNAVTAILFALARRERIVDIAARCGVSEARIRQIRDGHGWNHVARNAAHLASQLAAGTLTTAEVDAAARSFIEGEARS